MLEAWETKHGKIPAGTFAIGVLWFGDPATLARFLGVALILGGVVTLKLAH